MKVVFNPHIDFSTTGTFVGDYVADLVTSLKEKLDDALKISDSVSIVASPLIISILQSTKDAKFDPQYVTSVDAVGYFEYSDKKIPIVSDSSLI